MSTDFIDDDLIQRREAVRQVKIGPDAASETAAVVAPKTGPVPVQELNLTPLAQRRNEINNQMVDRMNELERLRSRQQALEKERNALEQLRQNQEKYETGKQDLIERLDQYLVYLEREDVRLHQNMTLVTETTASFKDMLEMARGLDESRWPTDSTGFREELHRALVIVENARKEFNQAIARIEALHGEKAAPMPAIRAATPRAATAQRSFGSWIMMGLAVSLPLIVTLIAIAVVMYFLFAYP
jgi:DNA repair exonuclease SbcCD ATPase subunit